MVTLLLLRHATAGAAARDEERPLSEGGRREAVAVAGVVGRHDSRLILCSTARRARETAAAVTAVLPRAQIWHERALYLASAEVLVDRCREIDDEQDSALVVGHNPGLHELAMILCRDDADRARLARRFPPAALAVLELPGTWADVRPGSAGLVGLHVSR